MDTQDATATIAHNEERIQSLTRQLRTLELHASQFGPFIPPHIQAGLDQVKHTITACRIAINKLHPSRPAPQEPPAPVKKARTPRRTRDRAPSLDAAELDRRIQIVGKATFVVLCASLLGGGGDDETLMALIPDTNKRAAKRTILRTAQRLVDGKHTAAALTRIIASDLDAEIIAEARRIRDSL